MSNTFPEPWKSLAEAVGIQTYGQLASRSGLSRPTVYSAVSGRSAKPHIKTLAGLARAFRISTEDLMRILGQPIEEEIDPYTPPQEAALLTRRERDHVDELIRLLVASRSKPFVLGESRLDEAVLKDEDMLSDDARTYTAEAEAKLQAVLQGGYVPAARHHEPDPLEGLGEENQDWEEK